MSKDEKDAKFVAELVITSPAGSETVRSFDTAWHRALERPVPVHVQFIRFVRKES